MSVLRRSTRAWLPSALKTCVQPTLTVPVAEECITAEPVLFPAYRLLQTAHAALRAPSQMLALCASRVTEGKVSAAMCARAMRDMRRVHETLFYGGDTAYDKLRASEADAGHTGRLSALKMRTLPLPADCANRSRRVWHDFGGVPPYSRCIHPFGACASRAAACLGSRLVGLHKGSAASSGNV